MKLAVISDIHANLEALQTVLRAIDDLGVDRIWCAGDVVGYGPDPGPCIDLLRERGIETVCGNHDEAVVRGEPRDRMLPEALQVVQWTRTQLTPDQIDWLASLPPLRVLPWFELVHASLIPDPPWAYIIDEEGALYHFAYQDCPLVFNGHTHVPLAVLHRSGQRPRLSILQSMFLPRRHRCMIGVGSVGQPRDGDPRAAFVVYEPENCFLEVRRVAYDFARTQARILRKGLPELFARRLAIGR